MEKNYYEILEIDRHASKEIIKKAYTTLAKKYHPDLQPDNMKKVSEEKFKLINEAYEVLSNPSRKEQYDIELSAKQQENTSIAEDILNENVKLKNELNRIKNYSNFNSANTNSQEVNSQYQQQEYEQQQYRQNLEDAVEQAYYDAYITDMKNRGYHIRYKKSFKYYIVTFISILLVFFVFFILWQIPFIKNYFINLYYQNEAFKFIVDFIMNIINSFKK